jgi:hypothetical protein
LLEYFLLCNRNVREGCAEPVEDDSSLWKEKEKAAEVVIGFVIEAGNG